MSTQTHPAWCESTRCGAGHSTGMFGVHRSQPIRGDFDVELGVSFEVSLWQVNGGRTHVPFEFPGGGGEGNELSPAQSRQLAVALADVLTRCEPDDVEPAMSAGTEQ
jgi:hypothetical protein